MTNFLDHKQPPRPKLQAGTPGNHIIVIILILIILAGGGLAYWYAGRAVREEGVSLANLPPQPQLSHDEIKEILSAVGRHILLPEGEPLIATVEDAETLKQVQPFFSLSQNGDQLLVYPDKAFIYRSSEDKLINVGPVYRSDENQPTNQPNE